MNCAHGPCNCQDLNINGANGAQYCSRECETAAQGQEQRCACGHAACGDRMS